MFSCRPSPTPCWRAWTIRRCSKSAGARLAFTTDSFVVKPLFFRGGDIGSLAVHGTVNDLAMGGAAAAVPERGLHSGRRLPAGRPAPHRRLHGAGGRSARASPSSPAIPRWWRTAAATASSSIPPASAWSRPGVDLSAANARPGDAVILSGAIGDHGIAILTAARRPGVGGRHRERFRAAPRAGGRHAGGVTREIRAMRDPTRGGLASALNEIAAQSRVGIAAARRRHPDARGGARRLRDAGARSALRGQRRQAGGHRAAGSGRCRASPPCAAIRSAREAAVIGSRDRAATPAWSPCGRPSAPPASWTCWPAINCRGFAEPLCTKWASPTAILEAVRKEAAVH